jgi:hypothetical protein
MGTRVYCEHCHARATLCSIDEYRFRVLAASELRRIQLYCHYCHAERFHTTARPRKRNALQSLPDDDR